MRSQADPQFSALSDRVKTGKINERDIAFFNSRIVDCPSERVNENFKSGKLSIIVTTNSKKDFINHQKLEQLLPEEKEFVCDSKDRVVNLPDDNDLPVSLKRNAGRTGNLQTRLKLKVGAPVVITANNTKRKYREDGLVNGARGYVQAIQVSKDDPEKVEVVWVVFNNEDIGKLYRFEHRHLRSNFNPGHKLATPILPVRRTFKTNFGNIEYQRQNFALSLAYAVTAHKCQGLTLDEVIIDFGPEPDLKIKAFIIAGSFYVALTRVRLGKNVYLKSFDVSYIQVNEAIEKKIEAMIACRSYVFKKVYLDNEVFETSSKEIKVGYLNINGLLEGCHLNYFDADKNLLNVDLMVLAETKLMPNVKTQIIEDQLQNWKILDRFDAESGKKNMGLLLLTPKEKSYNKFESVTHHTSKRNNCLQIQGIIVRLKCKLSFGFVYCRSSPNDEDIHYINKVYGNCDGLMGDLNLSIRIKSQKTKLRTICGDCKFSALNEITRAISNNQLDYIIIDKKFKDHIFSTSYYNFISDHKSITLRIGLGGNTLRPEILQKLNFDEESHLKPKSFTRKLSFSESSSESDMVISSGTSDSVSDLEEEMNSSSIKRFNRKFLNVDASTCWLNSCLQLLLTALDRFEDITFLFSDLGCELLSLRNSEADSLNPQIFKDILVTTEDTRIAKRLSDVTGSFNDEVEARNEERIILRERHNLKEGYQCVRDLFLCLQANNDSWPEVCSILEFKVSQSTTCIACGHQNSLEVAQMYLELQVPEENSSLNIRVEEFFNQSELVTMKCEDGCQKIVQAEKRARLVCGLETKFFCGYLIKSNSK